MEDTPEMTSFEKHLIYFADVDGNMTYSSIKSAILRLQLDYGISYHLEAGIIAMAIMSRFSDLTYTEPDVWFTSNLKNWKLPVKDCLKGKHPSSMNIWDFDGSVNEDNLQKLIKQIAEESNTDKQKEGVQELLDTCKERDLDALKKGNISVCPYKNFTKASIDDGRNFGNTSWKFFFRILGHYGPINEETIRLFFTDATVIFETIAKQKAL